MQLNCLVQGTLYQGFSYYKCNRRRREDEDMNKMLLACIYWEMNKELGLSKKHHNNVLTMYLVTYHNKVFGNYDDDKNHDKRCTSQG